MVGENPTVLVVEDESALAELYAEWLRDEYDVRVAGDYEEALEAVDGAVDVALLDRRLPERSGGDVLAEIRDRGLDCRVAMVTAVVPEFDIVEMGFDDYLTKPVEREDLRGTVAALLRLAEYDDLLQEQFALASKKAALEAHHSRQKLADSEEYARLQRRLAELEEQVDDTVAEFDDEDFAVAFRRLSVDA